MDFGVDSAYKIVLQYLIRNSYINDTEILANNCKSKIMGVGIPLMISWILTCITQDLLSLAYNINKSKITSSNIWNGDSLWMTGREGQWLVLPCLGKSSGQQQTVTGLLKGLRPTVDHDQHVTRMRPTEDQGSHSR